MAGSRDDVRTATPAAELPVQRTAPPGGRLRLLGEWRLDIDEEPVAAPVGVQRLLAFLGLHGSTARTQVAGTLWPDAADDQAHHSLRSTLWRLRRVGEHLVVEQQGVIRLSDGLALDVDELRATAATLQRASGLRGPLPSAAGLEEELLPGWYDDWVVLERERLRQLRLHALEGLASALSRTGEHGAALDAALAAVCAEPLRESAHRLVIRLHLAEGNASEAIRSYQRYRKLLADELDVAPSPQIRDLVRPLLRGRAGDERR